MLTEEQQFELFEKYLEGTLSKEEKELFENRISQDANFAKSFNLYKEASGYLKHHFSEERAHTLSSIEKVGDAYFNTGTNPVSTKEAESKTTTSKKESKVIKIRPMHYSIAASIILLIGFFLYQHNNQVIPDDYIFSDTISLTERNGETITNEAEVSFNNGNYIKAIEHFTTLLKTDVSNTEYQFYKAIAHDAIHEFDEADSLFNKLINGNSAYKYKATYYASISQWRRDNIEKATSLLKTIPAQADEYKKARKLLEKL